MGDGENVVYVWCTACGHKAEMREDDLPKASLRHQFRCSKCGERKADVRVVWRLLDWPVRRGAKE